jgi:hypothetical protein
MANELSGLPLGRQSLAQLNAAEQTFKPPGAAFNLLEKLKKGRSCNIVVNGDSTSTLTGGTATPLSSWLYLLIANYLAVQFPEVTFVMKSSFNISTGAYDVSTTIQTGSGSGTCTIYNASIGGTGPTYIYGGSTFFEAYMPSAVTADLIIFNHGFNVQATVGDRFAFASYMDHRHPAKPPFDR